MAGPEAPRGSTEPIIVVATWDVDEEHAGLVRALVDELRTCSLGEPGCLAYDVLRSREVAGRFVLVEHYDSPASHRAHRETEHFQRIVMQGIVPLLSARTVEVLGPLRGG